MPTPSKNIIATYTEYLPQVRRTFHLYQDRVEIIARWTFGKEFRVTVLLKNLSGQFTSRMVKNRWFSKAIAIGSISVGAALVFSRGQYADIIRRMASFCWPIAGVAFAVSLISFPKKQFVCFQQFNGKPGLDICQTIFSKAKFEDFIQKLRKSIATVKRN